MKTETARLLRALFYAYVGFTFVHIAYVVYHEPFAFDAWNMAVDTKAQPASVHNFFTFWRQQYMHANPRIGEEMAYLAYKITPVAEIGTPLAFLAIVVGGFMFGVGRRPRFDSLCDLATLSIGIGIIWIAAPNLPAYMFCRAYATNYIWLAAFQLWFLVPLRMLDPSAPAKVSIGKLAGYFVLGVISGMGNEHVGPTMILFTVIYGVWVWRKHHTLPKLLWIGVLGLLTGYALVFFAPGQSQRYEGLGEQHTLIGQIIVRGLGGNMNIYLDLFRSLGGLLALLVCIVGVGMWLYPGADSESTESRARQRAAMRTVVVVLVAGSLITVTVFASPKLGPRFYLHSALLATAAIQGIANAFLQSRRAFRPFVIFAVLCSTIAALRTIPMYTRVKRASDERLAAFASTPIGADTSLDPWEQVGEDWWFLGDDLRDQKKQELVSQYFALHRVLFRAGDALKMLGRQDVKATFSYTFEDPKCMDEIEHLDLPEFIGRDIGALQHAFLDDIAEIQRFSKLATIDMKVDFLARQPPMPAKTLYIARWNHGELEGYTARLKRAGRSKRREIVLDPKLKQTPWQIYLTVVGEQPKLLGTSTDTKPFAYTPWSAGQYWTMACRDDYCFLLLAVVHTL